MNKIRWTRWSIVGCTVIALGLLVGHAEAQKTKGKTRAALTKQLMKGFVAANCGDLGKLLKADPPSWDDITLKAAMLNEAGYILLDDGRCPDGDWANASKAIQAASVEVLAAAEKKDLEATNAAFKKLTTEGCAACHKVHKK